MHFHCAAAIRAAILLVAILASGPLHASYRIDYVIEPYHEGVLDSWMRDINEEGVATGYVTTRDELGNVVDRPVLYSDGTYEYLVDSPSTSGTGRRINAQRDVLGSLNGQPTFFPHSGPPVPIEVPSSEVEPFFYGAHDLNDAGNVLVGVTSEEQPADVEFRFGFWSPNSWNPLTELDRLFPRLLPPVPDDYSSGPYMDTFPFPLTRLNSAGQFAAGRQRFEVDPKDPANPDDDVFIESFPDAFVYDGVGGYTLLEPSPSGKAVFPVAVADDGKVLAWIEDFNVENDTQLGFWNADGTFDKLLPATENPLPMAGFDVVELNSAGEVLALDMEHNVLLLEPGSDAWINLTPSIKNLDGGSIYRFDGFNSNGQSVGYALSPQGGLVGYVVSPVPEPSSVALWTIASGMLGILAFRVRNSKPIA